MLSAASAFALAGNQISCERHGSGHINETYLLTTDSSREYVLQKINRHVFRDVPGLMRNVSAVTRHLARKASDPRHVLALLPTLSGDDYFLDEEGEYWRVYDFIPDSLCLQKAESPGDFFESAVAFGRFQNLLADFPAHTLAETIPRFHDTPNRYAALHRAVQADTKERYRKTRAEVDFALEREAEASTMTGMLSRGELPKRVTHNDTKLNNVMLDAHTRKALCVIDLDTVMPGLAANDFGDSIRFGASTAAEDEKDLAKVELSLPLYEIYTRGFLGECGKRFAEAEIKTLPLGAKLMTLENGVRFLTDYLSGDTYYRIHYPEQNLDRCRTQFKLAADMEGKWERMNEILLKIYRSTNEANVAVGCTRPSEHYRSSRK